MDDWIRSKALVFLCVSVLWWGPNVFGVLTVRQAAHLKRRIEEVTSKIEQVKLRVVNTHEVLSSLAQTGFAITEPKSCREVKSRLHAASDGDYTIHPFSMCQDTSIRVYCHNMSSENPEEFLTLPSGPDNNFAIKYGPRLQWSGAVWYRCSGPLYGFWNEAGETRFRKVRIEFENYKVKIIQDDFTFATTTGNNDVPYGVAGDCYSPLNGCGRGTLKVNLTGTDLKLAQGVQWTMWYTWPGDVTVQDMYISQDRKVASARCGGWCGHCKPEGDSILLSHPQCMGEN
ncbi:A disintegrin and metalloproteinase with thrombospondin motifs 9-like [Branchiostoma floridae x Branchiostoma japonicum]